MPLGFAQLAMLVNAYVHKSAKLKMAETELNETIKEVYFLFLYTVLMRWMKLEPSIQSEVSQKEKHKYSILTHIYGI